MNYSEIKNYKGLIFDLDGTLINSMPYHALAWKQVAYEHGFDIDVNDIYAMGGSASRDIAAFYKNKGEPVGDIDEYVKRKIAIFQENIPKIEVFQKIFNELKEAKSLGIRIAIGTGTRTANATRILKEKDLFDYIDALVTADDVTRHKPNPDTFLVAAKRLELEPQDCLVFEDGQLGIKAALRGGFDCIEVKDNEMINYFESDR
ncbi:MAG: HAD-IA family hydrolase [Succinivibrio sp.]|nr:HAD-IA family hydrolase [Succinivibrio sp.]MDD6376543.1 HAD-IA family hydrolase [Succinatimonas sp.]MDY5063993.1 HAD-IA family hydrolase [Succinivibrio sp.]MDY5994114.1 HAD-IA family hydrolase [Succinivibrio sp.]PWM83317.1 MAG: carotenoid dehydrogenase [Succinivibrio sp.]